MKSKTEIPELLAPAELAKLLHITERTLTNWRHQSRGPKYLKLGKSRRSAVLYSSADLIEWLDEQKRNSK